MSLYYSRAWVTQEIVLAQQAVISSEHGTYDLETIYKSFKDTRIEEKASELSEYTAYCTRQLSSLTWSYQYSNGTALLIKQQMVFGTPNVASIWMMNVRPRVY
jgi:hypothetical protein